MPHRSALFCEELIYVAMKYLVCCVLYGNEHEVYLVLYMLTGCCCLLLLWLLSGFCWSKISFLDFNE